MSADMMRRLRLLSQDACYPCLTGMLYQALRVQVVWWQVQDQQHMRVTLSNPLLLGCVDALCSATAAQRAAVYARQSTTAWQLSGGFVLIMLCRHCKPPDCQLGAHCAALIVAEQRGRGRKDEGQGGAGEEDAAGDDQEQEPAEQGGEEGNREGAHLGGSARVSLLACLLACVRASK